MKSSSRINQIHLTFSHLHSQRGQSQTRDAHGFLHKQLGVIFSDLTVTGIGGVRLNIQTFPDAVLGFLLFPVIEVLKRLNKTSKTIISGFNGFVRPGEMCFVLGRPNSGCSTFLKVIANQRIGFKDVTGSVEYGGIEADTMSKRYTGESVTFVKPTLKIRDQILIYITLSLSSSSEWFTIQRYRSIP